MAKKKTNNKKPIVKQPKIVDASAKLRKKPNYKSFRFHKRIKHTGAKLPNWWQLSRKSIALMRANTRPLLMFLLVYGLLMILLVRGFASIVDINSIQDTLDDSFGVEQTSQIEDSLTTFGLLIDSSTQGSGEIAQVYQLFLIIIATLAIIWLFRQQQAGNKVTMKMAFYRGMYPIIPFILVILVISLQLIPAVIGNFLFTTVISNGLAVNGLEVALWLLVLILTVLLSLYMLSNSLIALFVVTLPEMTPMQALRQSRDLVRYRRFSIMRKIFALLLLILIGLFIVVLPVIYFAPLVAEWLFFIITILLIPFVIGYMFSLYRELL